MGRLCPLQHQFSTIENFALTSSVNNSYSVNAELSSAAFQVPAAMVSYAYMRCFSFCQAGQFSHNHILFTSPMQHQLLFLHLNISVFFIYVYASKTMPMSTMIYVHLHFLPLPANRLWGTVGKYK